MYLHWQSHLFLPPNKAFFMTSCGLVSICKPVNLKSSLRRVANTVKRCRDSCLVHIVCSAPLINKLSKRTCLPNKLCYYFLSPCSRYHCHRKHISSYKIISKRFEKPLRLGDLAVSTQKLEKRRNFFLAAAALRL